MQKKVTFVPEKMEFIEDAGFEVQASSRSGYRPSGGRANKTQSTRRGIRIGSEDVEKSRFIDKVIKRLRS